MSKLSSLDDDAVKLNIITVASGVRVTEACVAPIRQNTITGTILLEMDKPIAWAIEPDAKKSGKIIPPGNFPEHASAIAISFAIPTCSAAEADPNGIEGSTFAMLVKALDSPCFVEAKAVFCPSTITCKLPSPQNKVWG